MTVPWAARSIAIEIDRSLSTPINGQIAATLRSAILEGRLRPGARLPSWLDLASQLGVARGTVRAAYEALADEFLIVSAGASGTRVAEGTTAKPAADVDIARPLEGLLRGFSLKPLPFQMGVPAQDAFPAKLWSRLRTRAAREDAMAPVGPADPRGHQGLRAEIASMLAITRSISCVPDQVILTSGFKNGLCLTLLAIAAHGSEAWIEDPGFPLARNGLVLAGVKPVPVAVDSEGIRVDLGIAGAPKAKLAIVTPTEQAPTGVSLSPRRRRELLDWASREKSWIIEDDYLGGLQLSGRVSPALAAEDRGTRVIHIGTFSKSLSPALGLGFVVAPVELAARFADVAAFLSPAPNTTTQLALANFLSEGYFLRHLRHMKRLYRERLEALEARLKLSIDVEPAGGPALLARLPRGTDDVGLARRAVDHGIAPLPLSIWFEESSSALPGLLLSATNVNSRNLERASQTLLQLIAEV